MRPFAAVSSATLAIAIVTTTTGSPRAGMSDAEQARRRAVVAHIGPATVSAGELEDRLAVVPRFQLKAFGDSADTIRRRFFDQVLLPEVLYSLAADERHLGEHLPASNNIMRARGAAASQAFLRAQRTAQSIGMPEVQSYFDANRLRYDTPERLYLFRILCGTREQAVDVLAAAKKEPNLEAFTKLARDTSIDKATSMRAGNLGYVNPDGVSSEAGLSIDPAVVRAAALVKDGEFVAEPVVEKAGPSTAYAVVWRRGTVPANRRTVQEAAAQIRETIWKEEAERVSRAHLQELRETHLTELNESLINTIDVSAGEGEVVTRRRPGEVPPLGQPGRNAPRPTN